MLDRQQRLGVAEGGLVGSGDVPGHVRADPDGQSHHGPRQQANRATAGERCRRERPEAGNEQERDPLGEEHVLDEMSREEVAAGEGVDGSSEGEHEQDEPGREGGLAPAAGGSQALLAQIPAAEEQHDHELGPPGLDGERRRLHGATLDDRLAPPARPGDV